MVPVRARKVMRTASDVALAAFFALNVPLVLFIDASAVLPPRFFPSAAARLLDWHIRTTGDYLMRDKPPFFRGLVVAEIFFQLPLYVVNAYAFFTGKSWRCLSGVVYGVHTATTMVPILYDIACSHVATRAVLFMIYVPYLIIPLLALARLLPEAYYALESKAKSKAN